MTENTKTLIFMATGLIAISIAVTTQKEGVEEEAVSTDAGQSFFPDFDNPLEVNKLQVVGFDEEKGAAARFEVVSTPKGWFIPSHENYPADADNQLEDVASMLIGVDKLDVESSDRASHKNYGVVNPEKAESGSSGVGKLVRLSRDSDTMAELIIGDSFDAPSGVDSTRSLYYVREPGKDRVYSADLRNVDDVSTKFVDWVEKDFLDLDKWDVKKVHFDNYDFDENAKSLAEAKRQIDKQTLVYADGNWTSPDLVLQEGEALDKDILDGLKDALDDLEIIDVERKPELLAESLKKGNEFHDLKSQPQLMAIGRSLGDKGFYVVGGPNGLEVISNKGEIHVSMKDGVKYVLRFGEVYLGDESDENATGDSRYLYALAQLDPTLLSPPELEPIPEALPPAKIAPTKDANASNNSQPGNKGPEGKTGPAETKEDANFPPPPTPPDANATAALEQARVKRNQEIASAKARNAAKQKEYNEKLAKAKERVAELNARLAPWYYVISNEVYEKIQLEKKDFVKAPEKKAEPTPKPSEPKEGEPPR